MKARISDLVQQVNADVRDAILDIQTAAKLVDAARSNADLAREALDEAQQRFRAGIADSLPVSQALTTSQQASDQYISALYQHNVAKLALARALGVATASYRDYVKGTAPGTSPAATPSAVVPAGNRNSTTTGASAPKTNDIGGR